MELGISSLELSASSELATLCSQSKCATKLRYIPFYGYKTHTARGQPNAYRLTVEESHGRLPRQPATHTPDPPDPQRPKASSSRPSRPECRRSLVPSSPDLNGTHLPAQPCNSLSKIPKINQTSDWTHFFCINFLQL